jgi:hypothetical protein
LQQKNFKGTNFPRKFPWIANLCGKLSSITFILLEISRKLVLHFPKDFLFCNFCLRSWKIFLVVHIKFMMMNFRVLNFSTPWIEERNDDPIKNPSLHLSPKKISQKLTRKFSRTKKKKTFICYFLRYFTLN